ncbi:hypothetical protein DPMN_069422 [Dreissena polymorpha]|uniref:Uncharacterized protein n=1 Tax=Dreissena polymorpha TaxID=45954 RepID=A0A9D3Z3I8_DREPO|nr:hypothetical protein DPMN_069422 [Dreissena polymorpha]
MLYNLKLKLLTPVKLHVNRKPFIQISLHVTQWRLIKMVTRLVQKVHPTRQNASICRTCTAISSR